MASRQGWSVEAFDPSAEMLAVARRRWEAEGRPSITWHQMGLPGPLEFEAQGFDLIVSSLCLEHVERLGRAMRELSRLLRPDGDLIFSVFHPDAYARGWTADCHLEGQRHVLPVAAHSRSAYLDACEQARLKIHRLEELHLGLVPAGMIPPADQEALADQKICMIVHARREGDL